VSSVHVQDGFSPDINVKITARENGRIVAVRKAHNVITNAGRYWALRRLGAATLDLSPPTPHLTTLPMYMGIGCGGALQTDAGRLGLSTAQTEQVTVQSCEDPVAVTAGVYLKRLYNQDLGSTTYFPSDYRMVFITDFMETDISFAANQTTGSSKVVGTSVPLSEVSLHLSDAAPGVDPLSALNAIAYNICSPIVITPSVSLRVEWEWRI